MTPDQFAKLLTLLERLVSKQYTITGAADWPILAALCVLIAGLIGFMWRDLKTSIQGQKSEVDRKIESLKLDTERDRDALWDAMKDCQDECCPRGRKDK